MTDHQSLPRLLLMTCWRSSAGWNRALVGYDRSKPSLRRLVTASLENMLRSHGCTKMLHCFCEKRTRPTCPISKAGTSAHRDGAVVSTRPFVVQRFSQHDRLTGMRGLLIASTLLVLLSGCGSEPSAGAGPERPPMSSENPDRSGDHDRVDRWETAQGLAEVSIELDKSVIHSGERIALRLINQGKVPLITGRPFTVETWDGQAWTEVPLPKNSAWTMEGVIIPPGARNETQYWPFDEMSHPEPGQYPMPRSLS